MSNYETYAYITVPAAFPAGAFLVALGVTSDNAVLSGDRLFVAGKTQAELDSAFAAFDAAAARTAEGWAYVRALRDAKLADTDFTQVGDYPGSNKTAYATYRQQLRDIPQTQTDPFNVAWPAKPST